MPTTATVRIRGRHLQVIRARILRRDPLCVRCRKRGLIVASQEVDHVIPLGKGGKEEDSNRQGLCHDCNQAKRAEDFGYTRKFGCDENGLPVSGEHHWNEPTAVSATDDGCTGGAAATNGGRTGRGW